MTAPQKEITIIGGGIIGCSTAYFLTRHAFYSAATHRITLLEASSSNAGGGASGKAGGLLALWAFPQNIVPLSFKLHQELAKEHDGEKRWGYRRCWASQVDCKARVPPGLGAGYAQAGGVPTATAGAHAEPSKGLHKDHKMDSKALRKLGAPDDLDWLDTVHSLRGYDNMGTPDDTAQVHPELFTRSMAQLAEEAGVTIITGARVTSINKDTDGKSIRSVTYEKDGQEKTLPTTDCIVAAGPWTSRLLPQIPVTSSRAHSVVIKSPHPLSAYALFTAISLPAGFPTPTASKARGAAAAHAVPLKRGQSVEPEIYARPDGTAYACGPTDDTVPLPLTNAEVEVGEARCDDIIYQVSGISDELGRDGQVLAKQACYLPQGGPFIGEVGGVKGLVVAAGHTCWGIQNAPGTGKLVSELVLEGRTKSAKLGSCDPSRFM
ncbi:FAD dependent oxidoreductase [Pseudomassariella vexata]|uniref:FAD dependent oxidoreductase n=1 Tax=Pseudomassariella vexata TaxID=1141098 RepID=A0A1Y2DFL2_9PEZI|nr:FAD dependent oxidoreductase [Pseudomassariella vexata]ORY58048.1 FAD dependent oxidoreductase [Pseudomassariella vexata]